ncbi:cutinase family protein [Williamsia deligens]|uniref:Cutinase family protein n=1 Tax=Williamsia deligens TaxID=321325 RepID=A0ABW3G223_9NOCA|nr:cutinase family protein [Williamsia deligens]MCP2194498.1 Cutinase [Williamsia deligens]
MFAAASAVATLLVPAPAGAATASDCAPAVVIPIRGSGDGSVGPRTYGDMRTDGWEGATLSRLLTATYRDQPALRAVPIVSVGSGYPAVRTEDGIRDHSFGKSVRAGVSTAVDAYDSARSEGSPGCAPMAVVVGFSQGAAVARGVAIELAKRSVLAATVLMGDPFQKPGADGVMGTGSRGEGVWRNPLGAFVSGVDARGSDAFYSLRNVRRISVCHVGDPVCDFRVGTDLRGRPHTTYLADTTRFQTGAGAVPLGPSELDVLAATLRGDILWAKEQWTPAGRGSTGSAFT